MGTMRIKIDVIFGDKVDSTEYYQERASLLKEIAQMERKKGFINQSSANPDGSINIRVCDTSVAFRGVAKPLKRR